MLKLISELDNETKYVLKNELFYSNGSTHTDNDRHNFVCFDKYYYFNEEVMDDILTDNFFAQKRTEYVKNPRKYENLINNKTKYKFRYDFAIVDKNNYPYGLVILEDIFYNMEDAKVMKIEHPGYYNYITNIFISKSKLPNKIDSIFNELINFFINSKIFNKEDNINLYINVDNLNVDNFDAFITKDKLLNDSNNKKLNLKYHGKINNDYDVKYDTYKLVINHNEKALLKLFKKTYKIGRQVLNEDTLDNNRLISILKSYKLNKNKADYSIYEMNAFIYLHKFEHRAFILQPNLFNVEILLLNMMNNSDAMLNIGEFYKTILKHKPELRKNMRNVISIKDVDKNKLNGGFFNNMFYLDATKKLYDILIYNENRDYIYYEDNTLDIKYLHLKLPSSNTSNLFYIAFYLAFSIIDNIFRIHIYDKAGFIYFINDYEIVFKKNELLMDVANFDLPILYFPDDVKDYLDTNKYFNKIKEFLKEIGPILKDEVYSYRNVINCFELYEYECFIDKQTDELIIAYINHPEFCKYNNKKHTPFMNRFYNWLNKIIITPALSKLIPTENLEIPEEYRFNDDVNLVYEYNF